MVEDETAGRKRQRIVLQGYMQSIHFVRISGLLYEGSGCFELQGNSSIL